MCIYCTLTYVQNAYQSLQIAHKSALRYSLFITGNPTYKILCQLVGWLVSQLVDQLVALLVGWLVNIVDSQATIVDSQATNVDNQATIVGTQVAIVAIEAASLASGHLVMVLSLAVLWQNCMREGQSQK